MVANDIVFMWLVEVNAFCVALVRLKRKATALYITLQEHREQVISSNFPSNGDILIFGLLYLVLIKLHHFNANVVAD